MVNRCQRRVNVGSGGLRECFRYVDFSAQGLGHCPFCLRFYSG